ncbi:MAG: NfeD family protein [Firmicutes bacterium]|nr:NfeD family protein [[Eubacterium] siraeum]MCM1488437.1 NfeD family protein [Bacillota bacterium]
MSAISVICLVFLVVSSLSVAAALILRSVYGIKNFGLKKTWLNFKGKTIPVEDFFPHDVLGTLIFILIFSLFGLILAALDMPVPLIIFCGLVFSGLGLFLGRHIFLNLHKRLTGKALPDDRPNVGDSAVCKEKIIGTDYGIITFKYKGEDYDFPAFSVNETDIEQGERVTVVDKEQGACWVERLDEELSEPQ